MDLHAFLDQKGLIHSIATAAGIVVAGCGLKVAKHGNRSSSSQCGSADLLETAGCHLNAMGPAKVAHALEESGFCFLFAQNFHPSMRHVATVRKELGFPTIFNFLGPLSNPLQPKAMVVGVNSKDLGKLFATTLGQLGIESAWVVHGDEGLDEVGHFCWSSVFSLPYL